jgi:hypothetical protein
MLTVTVIMHVVGQIVTVLSVYMLSDAMLSVAMLIIAMLSV